MRTSRASDAKFSQTTRYPRTKNVIAPNRPFQAGLVMERTGIEPVTSGLQSRRSPS